MHRKTILVILLSICLNGYSQYLFEGQIVESVSDKTIYLSLIEDYRKFSRPYFEQIIKRTKIDSSGFFYFEGNDLPTDNRVYRIHIDGCKKTDLESNHLFRNCESTQSILFIANNKDTISFPMTFENEVLCDLASTNDKSSVFLEIDVLKEEMALDFYDFPTEASRKLNTKKWYANLQEFGRKSEEPLAELYIFDFLSDKRNETYNYYLQDISQNNYYQELGERLQSKYEKAGFTEFYLKEIMADQNLISFRKSVPWVWILLVLLMLSFLLNIYLLRQKRKTLINRKSLALEQLTSQEKNIVNQILLDKTNKEIASELFISLSTVKTHINNLYKKLNISSREEIRKHFS